MPSIPASNHPQPVGRRSSRRRMDASPTRGPVGASRCGQMGRSGGTVHFVGAAVAYRTPRIPPKKWEEHKTEVTEIYLNSKKLGMLWRRCVSDTVSTQRKWTYF